MVVAPGEKGVVSVSFRSSSGRGPETHKVVVLTDAAGQETIGLTVSAVVDPQMELIPRALSFGHVEDPACVNPREVSIMSHFKGPVHVTSVVSSTRFVKATLLEGKPAHKREAGRMRIELCGDCPPGALNATVTVATQTEKGPFSTSMTVVADVTGEGPVRGNPEGNVTNHIRQAK
jgi:hypothetical protein